MKEISVVIIDDNPTVADCIKKMILNISELNRYNTDISVMPEIIIPNILNIESEAKRIQNILIDKSYNFLLLDRGLYELYDGKKLQNKKYLDEKYYIKDGVEGTKVELLLSLIDFRCIKSFSGIIVYTYDRESQTGDWVVNPQEVKIDIFNLMPKNIKLKNIDVILTNTQIYKLAKISLYSKESKIIDGLSELGDKSDFKLYGLFIGEILYHRIINILNKKRNKILKEKKISTERKLIILFIIFTALGIGSNALYLILSAHLTNTSLIIISVTFSLIMPLIVLLANPTWLIDLFDNNKKEQ